MRAMSEYSLRPMVAADLPAVLAVQLQCYPPELIESAEALASRLALAPDLCWVATRGRALAAYLFTHPWPSSGLPALDARLSRQHESDPAGELTWFVHDMAVAPTGRGGGLARRLYEAARMAAVRAGLRSSRLVAVQAAAAWWQRLGYAAVTHAAGAPAPATLARYGDGAVLMEHSGIATG
jgi:GNAT superfamily N-acetyltransferase